MIGDGDVEMMSFLEDEMMQSLGHMATKKQRKWAAEGWWLGMWHVQQNECAKEHGEGGGNGSKGLSLPRISMYP